MFCSDMEQFQKEVMPSHSGKHLPTRGKLKFQVIKDIKQNYNYVHISRVKKLFISILNQILR